MSTPSEHDTSSPDAQAIPSTDASASSGAGGNNPIWLMVGACALFFAFAAALLASG
jgi:hypothetical protein